MAGREVRGCKQEGFGRNASGHSRSQCYASAAACSAALGRTAHGPIPGRCPGEEETDFRTILLAEAEEGTYPWEEELGEMTGEGQVDPGTDPGTVPPSPSLEMDMSADKNFSTFNWSLPAMVLASMV